MLAEQFPPLDSVPSEDKIGGTSGSGFVNKLRKSIDVQNNNAEINSLSNDFKGVNNDELKEKLLPMPDTSNVQSGSALINTVQYNQMWGQIEDESMECLSKTIRAEFRTTLYKV